MCRSLATRNYFFDRNQLIWLGAYVSGNGIARFDDRKIIWYAPFAPHYLILLLLRKNNMPRYQVVLGRVELQFLDRKLFDSYIFFRYNGAQLILGKGSDALNVYDDDVDAFHSLGVRNHFPQHVYFQFVFS